MSFDHLTDKVNSWLTELGTSADQAFVLDEEGRIGLNYEGLDCFLELDEEHGLVYLAIPLIEVPSHNDAEFLRQVLACNLYRQETGGATLALDPEQDQIVLCHHLEGEPADGVFFQNVLGNMLEISQSLQTRFSEQIQATSKAPDANMTATMELARFQA